MQLLSSLLVFCEIVSVWYLWYDVLFETGRE